jgi:hypothetical protein
LLSSVAQSAAIAIENARLYKDLQDRMEEWNLFYLWQGMGERGAVNHHFCGTGDSGSGLNGFKRTTGR